MWLEKKIISELLVFLILRFYLMLSILNDLLIKWFFLKVVAGIRVIESFDGVIYSWMKDVNVNEVWFWLFFLGLVRVFFV